MAARALLRPVPAALYTNSSDWSLHPAAPFACTFTVITHANHLHAALILCTYRPSSLLIARAITGKWPAILLHVRALALPSHASADAQHWPAALLLRTYPAPMH